MNTPTPDYGEPWHISDSYTFPIADRDGRAVTMGDRRTIACVNACSKMADPAAEIAAMREAIREAHVLMTDILRSFDSEEPHWIERPQVANALAKLQPFIQ